MSLLGDALSLMARVCSCLGSQDSLISGGLNAFVSHMVDLFLEG